MNRHFALAIVVAIAAAGPAIADDITIDPHPFVSTLSRAQVVQEMQAFRHSGVNPWADDYDPLAAARSSRTRADVVAEFMNERNAVAALSGEDSGSAYLTRMAAIKARPTGPVIAGVEVKRASAK
jgi:hypothetical protein